MYCDKCRNKITDDSKFCTECGTRIINNDGQRRVHWEEDDKKNTYSKTVYNSICQSCGVYGPTKYVEFYQNTGMLVLRRYRSIKGRLCKKCINEFFWDFTGHTFFLGWWGTISFCVTPFYLINNITRYLMSLKLKPPEEEK